MKVPPPLAHEVLNLDCERASQEIQNWIKETVGHRFHKKGIVLGVSGGIDSSCVAALCAQALGPKRVQGLLMPEGDSASSEESTQLGRLLAESQGIDVILEDISPVLEACGCYRRRDEAIRSVIPAYGPGWRSKIVLPSVIDSDQYRVFSVIAVSPEGEEIKARLNPKANMGIVAATNYKQRIRKTTEYYHADRLNYLVAGTPNRLEYDQGFFVKGGDGLADIKPIAHLYKTQVYQLAEYLGVPSEICERPPTTDTYSLPQTQEEFYFSLPYDQMDLCLWAKNHDKSAAEVGALIGLSELQVERVFRDIEGKRKVAYHLHHEPVLFEAI